MTKQKKPNIKKKIKNIRPSKTQKFSMLKVLKEVDKNLFIFALILISFLFLGTHIKLNLKKIWPTKVQLTKLNPDAKLYYNIAQNMVKNIGYYDTLRNTEILPSVGHPLLIALFSIKGGLSPTQFSWIFLLVSFIFLGLGIYIYTKSNICVLLSLWLYGNFFNYIKWLAGNVESSIILSNTLLILSLAYFYKKFNITSALMVGIALGINILIRPLFLFPIHISFLILLGLVLLKYLGKKTISILIKGWFIIFLVSEVIIMLTMSYSYIKYNDSRLVTGTYGAYPLYVANNIYLPTKGRYNTRDPRIPIEFKSNFKKLMDNPNKTWQEKHKILISKTITYWKSYPLRALSGWWWRFRQFIGIFSGNFSRKKPLTLYHTFSVSILIILIIFQIVNIIKKKDLKVLIMQSLGLLSLALFIGYSAIHSFFAYVGFRYVAPVLPFIVTANISLLYENLKNIRYFHL